MGGADSLGGFPPEVPRRAPRRLAAVPLAAGGASDVVVTPFVIGFGVNLFVFVVFVAVVVFVAGLVFVWAATSAGARR